MNSTLSASANLSSLPSQDRVTKNLIICLILVIVCSWGAMIWASYRTHQEAPPIPSIVLSHSGEKIMTAEDIVAGKAGFQKADLMDYGSLYGMGSYFGEDYTAQYLVELGRLVLIELAKDHYHQRVEELHDFQRLGLQHEMQTILKNISLNPDKVILPDTITRAITELRKKIVYDLTTDNFKKGWAKSASLSQEEANKTADFLIYSVMTTVGTRTGTNYSWTNNWPYEPSVGNTLTTAPFIWTWVSLAILFLAIGVVVAIFRLYIDHDEPNSNHEAILHTFSKLTPSQLALRKYFVIVALLLLVQIGAGSILAHYYAERETFYGINIASFLPFAFLRAVHIQTPIVWIGLGWIGSALFLAPMIGRREPYGQKFLVNLLFYVTLIIVVGALIGNYLGSMGVIQEHWFWFGNQGLSYLELGRFWQILFFVGLLSWSLIMLRTMWPTLKSLFSWNSFYSLFRIEHLIWYSTFGVAFIYAFGMIPLTHIHSSFTLTDFWRWWVVHLWVEWAFELFATAITGYFLMTVGLVSRKLAERAILFEWILILGSGILGTGHHLFWVGEPQLWLSIGTVFGFLEVLPLFLLILEAIQQYTHISKSSDFPYRLAFLYILGASFWNFVGAGVFGALINSALVNYYEHGTFLTLNHAHTAMFGAFGLLSLGLIYLVLRYLAGDRVTWNERLGIWAFWFYNIGLILWICLNFFPIGWPQLIAVFEHGYAYARSLEFYDTTLFWQWMRLPGDVIFAMGALFMAWDFIVKTRNLSTS